MLPLGPVHEHHQICCCMVSIVKSDDGNRHIVSLKPCCGMIQQFWEGNQRLESEVQGLQNRLGFWKQALSDVQMRCPVLLFFSVPQLMKMGRLLSQLGAQASGQGTFQLLHTYSLDARFKLCYAMHYVVV